MEKPNIAQNGSPCYLKQMFPIESRLDLKCNNMGLISALPLVWEWANHATSRGPVYLFYRTGGSGPHQTAWGSLGPFLHTSRHICSAGLKTQCCTKDRSLRKDNLHFKQRHCLQLWRCQARTSADIIPISSVVTSSRVLVPFTALPAAGKRPCSGQACRAVCLTAVLLYQVFVQKACWMESALYKDWVAVLHLPPTSSQNS